MHNITEIDAILTPADSKYRTWHGLEHKVEAVTLEEVERHGLHPRIYEGDVTIHVPNATRGVPMPKAKGLIAVKDGTPHPLHVGSEKYSIIQNRQVWDSMAAAFEGAEVDHKVSCIGTLGGLTKYFISVEVGDGKGFEVNGDRFHGNVNFVTSHDGSMRFSAFDSLIRIVCSNTLHAALSANKSFNFGVSHRGDTAEKCAEMSRFINELMVTREEFKVDMQKLAAEKVAMSDIEAVVGGYFLKTAASLPKVRANGFSGRTLAAIDKVSDLAINGRGNAGRSLYDVLNGATEYWTSGDGVGQKTDAGRKAYSSEFGTASKHKRDFADYLLEGYSDQIGEIAKETLALTA